MESQTSSLIFAILGGILPAFLWLWFWLKEDKAAPEPKFYIILTFIMGAAFVLVAKEIQLSFRNTLNIPNTPLDVLLKTDLIMAIGITTVWAFFEEALKLVAAFFGGLRSKVFDEPIDALVYLITAALGFAAFENTLYLLSELSAGSGWSGFMVSDMRFVGSTLLHILASGSIGAAIALSFYRKRALKIFNIVFGLILATVLHAIFNLFIMAGGKSSLFAFAIVWGGIIFLILIFEEIKNIKRAVYLD